MLVDIVYSYTSMLVSFYKRGSCPFSSSLLCLFRIILTNYLHSTGSRSRISACMTVSTPWDVEMSRQSLEEKLLNRLLYVNFLLGRLKNVVRKYVTFSPFSPTHYFSSFFFQLEISQN